LTCANATGAELARLAISQLCGEWLDLPRPDLAALLDHMRVRQHRSLPAATAKAAPDEFKDAADAQRQLKCGTSGRRAAWMSSVCFVHRGPAVPEGRQAPLVIACNRCGHPVAWWDGMYRPAGRPSFGMYAERSNRMLMNA